MGPSDSMRFSNSDTTIYGNAGQSHAGGIGTSTQRPPLTACCESSTISGMKDTSSRWMCLGDTCRHSNNLVVNASLSCTKSSHRNWLSSSRGVLSAAKPPDRASSSSPINSGNYHSKRRQDVTLKHTVSRAHLRSPHNKQHNTPQRTFSSTRFTMSGCSVATRSSSCIKLSRRPANGLSTAAA